MPQNTLVADLQRWIATHDDHVRAAVTLLIEHDYWLRNGRFIRVAVKQVEDGAYIMWSKARTACDASEFDRSSTSELAVLDLAIALGENRFKLTLMGSHNRKLIGNAVLTALGF